MKSQNMWSRRDFLHSLSVAGAGTALMLHPWAAWASHDVDPRVAAIVARTIGVDTHNHVDVPLTLADVPGPPIDLAGEMKRSGLSAICMTFALDYQKLLQPGDAYNRFMNGLASMDQQLINNGMKRALNLADLQAAHKAHQPTVIQSVEGGHFLEGKIQRLDEAYGRGLRHLGLLHDSDASVPLGDVYTNPPRWGGLTSFGADVIRQCNQLGILVDLAHANVATTAAALKIAAHPVIISHTGLDTQLGSNPSMAKMMMPRLIGRQQAKAVADAGGIIGVWTHLADTPIAYARNIQALVDVVGIDHVCIGTDTKLTTPYHPAGFGNNVNGGQGPHNDSGHDHNVTPFHKNQGAGGGPNHGRMGERTNQAWEEQKTGFYDTVVGAMVKIGFSDTEIGKIGGGNFCRVFDAATAGK